MPALDFKFLSHFKSYLPERWNQSVGNYDPNHGCCFGAHLFDLLCKIVEEYDWNWKMGKDAFLKRLNINEAQCALLFKKAGLNVCPFSIDHWNIPVSEVISNLEKINKVPEVEEADFRGCSFIRCDLGGLNLKNCNFKGVRFHNCNLAGATFAGSNCQLAEFIYCDLVETDFSIVDLREANFQSSNINNAKLLGAKIYLTNFRDCNINKEKIKEGIGEPILDKLYK